MIYPFVDVRGEGEAADANSAFDDAAEHIAKRLRRYRRRVNEHARDLSNRARPQAAREYVLRPDDGEALGHDTTEPDASALAASGLDEPEAAGAQPADAPSLAFATIVAETVTQISRLSVSEAVMQMDLSDQPVMMFHNCATGELNVVYRRTDGHIGWIDPSVAATRPG